ncbi:Asp-tRNA(Asn)/Glu-tRNA(Gln) amidotransferase subunit GatC [Gammaproteobacteria bacterium]|nr:Asp-tRNA(Asn)/Glu-tRNA(Gln) amidotransferase subunit GatC [Gammaproteobacteria bacterium]
MAIKEIDIGIDVINKTALLAKLKVADSEIEQVQNKLKKILNLCQVMNECDTNSVGLVDSQVTLISQLRQDQVDKTDITPHLNKHFDQFNGHSSFFEVPKVIEE